jgi:hypothetical protein
MSLAMMNASFPIRQYPDPCDIMCRMKALTFELFQDTRSKSSHLVQAFSP